LSLVPSRFVFLSHLEPIRKLKRQKGKVVYVHALKAYKGVEVQLHSFLTSTLDRGEWLQTFPDILSTQRCLTIS